MQLGQTDFVREEQDVSLWYFLEEVRRNEGRSFDEAATLTGPSSARARLLEVDGDALDCFHRAPSQ